MKIAVFFCDSITAAWSLGLGMTDTLKRMGHEVAECPIVPSAKTLSRAQFPELENFDVAIVSGPEHIGKHFRALYPQRPIPTLAWMHESVRREDYGKLDVDAIKRTADEIFCPAEEDTEFGFEFLPFGVDTHVFYPEWDAKRDIDLAFIGMMYPKRQQFFSQLPTEIRERLRIGNCLVQDLDGPNIRASAELYAKTLRRIKTLLLLPALSRLTVTKVYEARACGCAIAAPTSPKDAERAIAEAKPESWEQDRLELRLETMLSKVHATV